MKIKNLILKNIGPFENAEINFEGNLEDSNPVIIFTGENGTGKSIIVDAIRVLLLGSTQKIERQIHSNENFFMSLNIELPDKQDLTITSNSINRYGNYETNSYEFNKIFSSNKSSYEDNFIINYWSSKLSNESFKISHIQAPEMNSIFENSLSGVHGNSEVTKLITFFDYLKDSDEPNEKAIGTHISHLIKNIIKFSVTNGELKYISRTKLQPIISIFNREITLDKLSSGNLYLLQRLIYLLKQIYANCVKFDIPVEQIQNTPGILIIDEAENHLHPKWQKSFLSGLLNVFPNIQIIVTTHSPFIISSVNNSRIFVCSNTEKFSIVTEETDYYSNKPVEEILLSPLFNTSNFNSEISELLNKRKIAIESNNSKIISEIENRLLELNPEYFNFLNVEHLLKSLKK